MNEIIAIYYQHKGNYGYRRMTLELSNKGYVVNHKKVLRLMNKLNLLSIMRKKRKYSSYKGTVGKVAKDHIERNFEAETPNKKWFTDITEFKVKEEKVYLSPILDAHGRYIVSYNLSKKPDLTQINDMLDKAFEGLSNLDGLIFHSDQGWQYQHKSYQTRLKKLNIKQSMSRKGNSIDNGLMESFFGVLKSEMYYGREKNYNNADELMIAIDEYIEYYNNQRIKCKLKGLTPVQYRNQPRNLA